MTQVVQSLILSVLLGGVYALLASGMTLIFGIMRIVSLTHGALVIFAAFLTWSLWAHSGIDPLVSVVLIVPIMFAVGLVLYYTLIRRVAGTRLSSSILLTIGIALLLESLMGTVWGNSTHSVLPSYANQSFQIGGAQIPKTYVFGSVLAVVILIALFAYLTQTWQGRAIRACATNADGARLAGVSVTAVSAVSFSLGVATAGAGGAVVSVLYPFLPASHYQWIARLLAIVVLGGLGSISGASVAALILAAAEIFTGVYVSAAWATATPYIAILLILLIRPQGLFGTSLRQDVVNQ